MYWISFIYLKYKGYIGFRGRRRISVKLAPVMTGLLLQLFIQWPEANAAFLIRFPPGSC
jgi:hypothetical protein